MPDPGRQNESHPPRLSDLFDNLPTAGSQLPQPDHTPPPAGSRRAARQARQASGAIPVVSAQAAQEAAAQQAAQQQFLAQQQAAAAQFAAQQQAAAEQFAAQQRAAQQAAAAQLAAEEQLAAQQQMQQRASARPQFPAQQPVAPVQPEGAGQPRPAAVEQPQPVVPLSAAEPAQRVPEAPSITGPFSITVTGSQAIAEQQTASFPITTVPAFQARDEASRAAASAPEPAQQPIPQAAAFQPEPARRPASQEPSEQAPTPAPAVPDTQTGVFGGGGSDGPHEFDSLFAPESHHEPTKKKRGKGCLISLIVLLAILGGIAGAGAWVYNTYSDKINEVMGWGPSKDYEPGQASGEAFVTIKDGDTGQPISTALNAAGVTKTPSVFYDMLVQKGVSPTFYPGVYKLQKKMTADAALKALQDDANRMENTASVPEGGQIKNFLPTVAESLGMPLADLQAAVKNPADYGVKATSLEGWLFPAVYTFDPGSTAKEVVQKMVDRTRKSLADAGVAAGDEARVLTIASIVQREGHTADFGKVSRVIDNRLKPGNTETHGKLEMDSTAQYGYGLTHDGAVSSWPWKAVKADQNPWNTYAHQGLPATPISSPNDAAIKAAQNPEPGSWYYFVTVNLDTGETVFSSTYKEQQAAEEKYKAWCKANPDGGCY
ncbi:endolytic transglycosylase MltG [Microbacterium sp. NPDC057650]|uniref:endolytic transglycosylase MltG n=1 Tax=unclassified Microbacterium TaxID=2609290 RepID=UPI00366A6A63